MYTCLANGKTYVGQTRSPRERHLEHMRAKDECPFHYAIKKYGQSAFSYEILLQDLTELEANDYERYLIDVLDSTSHGNGYNVQIGGAGYAIRNCKRGHDRHLPGAVNTQGSCKKCLSDREKQDRRDNPEKWRSISQVKRAAAKARPETMEKIRARDRKRAKSEAGRKARKLYAARKMAEIKSDPERHEAWKAQQRARNNRRKAANHHVPLP